MQLHVGGLSDDLNEDELRGLFAKFGTIELFKIIRDIVSGVSKGFAIVRMPVDAEAEEAIKELNGLNLGDNRITVSRMHETLPGEMQFREWLRDNAREVLLGIGVKYGQTVLDYGCGPGIFSLASATIVGKEGKVYALDVRSGAVERLKKEASTRGLTNIKTMLLDRSLVSVPLRNQSLDVILLYDVLQEISGQQFLFEELYRILRQGGLLSVFPMHLGTDRVLNMINTLGLFRFKEIHGPSGFQSASEIINFEKMSIPPNWPISLT